MHKFQINMFNIFSVYARANNSNHICEDILMGTKSSNKSDSVNQSSHNQSYLFHFKIHRYNLQSLKLVCVYYVFGCKIKCMVDVKLISFVLPATILISSATSTDVRITNTDNPIFNTRKLACIEHN